MGIRATDNRVASVLAAYRSQLAPLYDAGECKAIVRSVFRDRLGWDAAQLDLRASEPLHESELLKVYLPLKRLRAGEPLPYVLGAVEFHGLPIRVTPDVLIPRPETEELVELVLRDSADARAVVDIGTGSGCIALAIAKARPGAHVTAIDDSAAALAVAAGNARALGIGITLMQADALSEGFGLPAGTDLVVSNPPYIPVEEERSLAPQVRDHEPPQALFAPPGDPLAFYRAIGHKAHGALPVGGRLWLEGHWRTVREAAALLNGMGYAQVSLLRDLSGNERFIRAVR